MVRKRESKDYLSSRIVVLHANLTIGTHLEFSQLHSTHLPRLQVLIHNFWPPQQFSIPLPILLTIIPRLLPRNTLQMPPTTHTDSAQNPIATYRLSTSFLPPAC